MKLPTYVQIEPVGQCNLRCQMCPIQFRKDGPPYGPPAFMEFETFTRIVDQFVTLQTLHLQGLGEPMMHPRFFDMVAYAANKGIQVTTNSNLTLLNQKRAQLCVTSGLDCLHVSIDGATAETYDRIRVGSRFEQVVRNLELVLEAKRQFESKHPHIHLVMVVMRQNLTELPDLVQLAHQWSVEQMFVQHLCHDFGESSLPEHYQPMREFVQSQTLLEEDQKCVEHYFSEARDVAKNLGVNLRLPRTKSRIHPPNTPGQERCDWPWKGAYISYQGYAMPCCMVSTPDRINFGNIVDQGVEETWNGQAYQAFREQLASAQPPDVCRSCSIYSGTF
ncbi:MAG: radical SAM protein [Cyanobacteriota bacterium]